MRGEGSVVVTVLNHLHRGLPNISLYTRNPALLRKRKRRELYIFFSLRRIEAIIGRALSVSVCLGRMLPEKKYTGFETPI